MRQAVKNQIPLTAIWPDHEIAKELKIISDILDRHPIIAGLAMQDLCGEDLKNVGLKVFLRIR